jgi:hypothetical protein
LEKRNIILGIVLFITQNTLFLSFDFTTQYHIFLAPTSLIQTQSRSEVASFSTPLILGYQSLFIKNPVNVFNYTAYLEPVTTLSWVIVLIFLATVPFALYVVASGTAQTSDKMSLGQSFSATYVALLRFGSDNNPSRVSTRITFVR